jgi:hypothetical protein
MDAQWLQSPVAWLRALAILLLALPPLFILLSRRARVAAKLAWLVASQLPWGFALLYTWVWEQRYAGAGGDAPMLGATVLADAVGWWTYAFPWAIYLLYRATRKRFSGESRATHP